MKQLLPSLPLLIIITTAKGNKNFNFYRNSNLRFLNRRAKSSYVTKSVPKNLVEKNKKDVPVVQDKCSVSDLNFIPDRLPAVIREIGNNEQQNQSRSQHFGKSDGFNGIHHNSNSNYFHEKDKNGNPSSSSSFWKSLAPILREVLNSELFLTVFRWGLAFHLVMNVVKDMSSALEDADDGTNSSSNYPFRNLVLCFEEEKDDNISDNDISSKDDVLKDENKKRAGTRKKIANESSKEDHEVKLSAKEVLARQIAQKLYDAGLPTQQELDSQARSQTGESQQNGHTSEPISVEQIVKSLTKTEIAMLHQSLLNQSSGTIADATKEEISIKKDGILMDDIGGLDAIKDDLSEVIFAMSNPHIMNGAYGSLLNAPKGILLYGPPGCGKTMLARALSAEVGARFLCIAPSSLLRKYVGETNQMVKALFSLVSFELKL